MSFGTFAGTAIVPTLSRIVLGIAFVTAGYNKVFNKVEFAGDDAQRLINLQIVSGPTVTASSPQTVIRPASLFQEEPDPAEDPPDVDPPDVDPPDVDPPIEDEAESAVDTVQEKSKDIVDAASQGVQDTAERVSDRIDQTTRDIADKLPDADSTDITLPSEDGVDTMAEARAMHHVTLMLDRQGWAYPVWQARLLAFTELIGGALLLVGLFSRLWGLGLAIAMAVAFYLTSLDAYFTTGVFSTAASDLSLFNRVFVQASLFVLAFGVFLTGPGPFSLDRLFFGRRAVKGETVREPSFE